VEQELFTFWSPLRCSGVSCCLIFSFLCTVLSTIVLSFCPLSFGHCIVYPLSWILITPLVSSKHIIFEKKISQGYFTIENIVNLHWRRKEIATFFFNIFILDLDTVEPAEGRLEFLAYMIDEDHNNESIQVIFWFSYPQLFVGGLMSYLRYLCLFAYICVLSILCCVFVLFIFF
jgi:hypothetical protein